MKRLQLGTIVLALAVSLTVALGVAVAAGGSAAQAVTVKTATTRLGRILVDGRGRTLYLFEKDRRGHSACSGFCATYWPPLLTRAKPVAGGGAKRSLLGLIRRANGSKQVTYAGHPLYRYVGDSRPGQTTGEGSHQFGAGWDVLSPAGKKIERGG